MTPPPLRRHCPVSSTAWGEGLSSASFTEVVRQELSRLPVTGAGAARAELIGLVRTTGRLTVAGGERTGPVLSVVTASGAVARRAHHLVMTALDLRPELRVRAASGVRHAPRYGVLLPDDGGRAARLLEVLDERGRPRTDAPQLAGGAEEVALVRGALLGGGSVSRPGRAAHLEIAVNHPDTAPWLATLVSGLTGTATGVPATGRPRVVVKSGAGIADLLAAVGAVGAYLAVDEQRLRRELRGAANRLANADRANLGRTIEASGAQVAAVRQAVARQGWDGLPAGLREVALVRLANPEASLAELGSLLDPPVGRSTVHRRLARLATLAGGADTVEGEAEDP